MSEPPDTPSSLSPITLPARLSATLILVRHGESEWVAEGRFQGRRDPPLSALGRRQAEMVAARLAERTAATALPLPTGTPAGIWHSPLARAAETARLIAEALPGRPPLHAADELIELGQGEWEGLLHVEVSARWPAELAAWRRSPTSAQAPGGEPLLIAARRVRAGTETIVTELASTEPVQAGAADGSSDEAGDVASLHHRPVPGYPTPPPDGAAAEPWAIVVAHDGIFRLLLLTLLGVPYERFWSFPFNLCAITVVGLSEGIPTLRAHNLSEHLTPLAAEERAAAEARGDRRGAL